MCAGECRWGVVAEWVDLWHESTLRSKGSVDPGWWGIGKQAGQVIAGDDLNKGGSLDVVDFDE